MNESIHVVGSFILAGILLYGLWQGTRRRRRRHERKQASGHCCKVSDEAAFCLIQRPYISKTLLTRRISPRGSP